MWRFSKQVNGVFDMVGHSIQTYQKISELKTHLIAMHLSFPLDTAAAPALNSLIHLQRAMVAIQTQFYTGMKASNDIFMGCY